MMTKNKGWPLHNQIKLEINKKTFKAHKRILSQYQNCIKSKSSRLIIANVMIIIFVETIAS